MSLVQKYRPQTLLEVAGQRFTTTTLINSIKQDKLHAAYLFSGARGTGKTSTARAFAKSLNCETGITTEPCGICRTCKDVQSGVSFGVQEIDCAQHNGVDYFRDLAAKVCYSGYSRYKIYILDEPHNLSKQAFEAILKTLEEPGQKVVFILCTTEKSKIIPTVRSRCMEFDFKPLKNHELKAYCQQILDKEDVSIAPDLLNIIVSSSDGILRDTLTLLNKVILSEAKTENDIYELLGAVPAVDVIKLLNACVEGNYGIIYKELKDLFKSGSDPLQLLGEISNFVRNAITSQSEPIDYSIMTCDSKTYQAARTWGSKLPINKLVEVSIFLRDSETQFSNSKFPKLTLEATLLKLSQVFAER